MYRNRALLGMALLLILFFLSPLLATVSAAVLKGQITDPSEAAIPNAVITLQSAEGKQFQQKSSDTGYYEFRDLPFGTFHLTVVKPGFAPYDVLAFHFDKSNQLNVTLQVAEQKEEVNVESETQGVTTEQSENAGALVLKEKDIESLSDDPDELASELDALAGPGAGPNGAQIYIDGFTSSGTLPPKSAIREIRINRNPYSAEFDRVGFARVEILTKPGSDKFRGEASFGFSDNSFNSRNPLSETRAPYQTRQFSGRISGPLSKKSSFSLNFESRNMDESTLVNATVLNSQFQPVSFNQNVETPQWHIRTEARLDYQLNDKNTLVFRYNYTPSSSDNQGVGNFSLPTMAYSRDNTQHEVQLTETAIINPHTVNETRFQYRYTNNSQTALSSDPIINVQDSFTTGGASSGNAYQTTNYFELQNSTSYVHNKHSFKFGVRLRYSSQEDNSPGNFNGTYTFSGGMAADVDVNSVDCSRDYTGATFNMVQISSLEAYRRNLVLQSKGCSALNIRALGGGASQFSVSSGTAALSISQLDAGLFGTWDWQFRPSLTLSAGLRWEDQNNINFHKDFAPRLALAWAMDGKNGKPAKTVLRWGAGFFYDRISSTLVLQSKRYNGTNQKSYLVPNPNWFPNIPSTDVLNAYTTLQNTRILAKNIEPPYNFQTSIGIERQLPHNTMVAANYLFSRGVHLLRSRDVNPVISSTVDASTRAVTLVRLDPSQGGIYQYESSGLSRQHQIIVNFNTRFNKNVTFFGFYSFGSAYADTDGASSFPADPNNMHIEWGPSAFDVHHRVVIGGTFKTYWGVSLSPFLTASSGSPFNITTGKDNNYDGQYTDRPAFANGATGSNVVDTEWGDFLLTPAAGTTLISRNYGRGPGSFMLNLRVGKTWGLGRVMTTAKPASGQDGQQGMQAGGPPPGGGGKPGGGGMRGGPGGPGGGGDSTNRRYNLTLSVQATNLLNNVNLANPVGNLSSSYFGQSTQLAGGGWGGTTANNRRLVLQLRFTF